MRLNYSDDDEDYPGQFTLFQANCRRSLKGKAGQRELRALEAALLALPSKRLILGALEKDGDVCAVGAYAKHKGVALPPVDPDDDPDYDERDAVAVGVKAGMPPLVAWKVVELNDIDLDTVWERAEGPLNRHEAHYKGGIPLVRNMTPEERYEKVLAWVRAQLKGKA